MNLDKLFKLFLPKNISFFPLFDKSALNLIKASELLMALMSSENNEQRETLCNQIKAAENDGDDITHDIYDKLNRSFITPFDREDIHSLASTIDDVVDSINGASQRIFLYKPKILTPAFREIAQIINQGAREIEFSVTSLADIGSNKKKILKACKNLNMLETKADGLFHAGIIRLFDEENDATELIKSKEILETLEKAVDKADDVSDTIKTILIKIG
jgi:predicted phosphate transport protein (TIGR00153 family)